MTAHENVADLIVQIVRFVDDHQPGFVACEFDDADGRRHTIVEKVPVVTAEWLDALSSYPRPGSVACTVLERWRDASGRELARIDTDSPWSIESTEGLTVFVVVAAQLTPAAR